MKHVIISFLAFTIVSGCCFTADYCSAAELQLGFPIIDRSKQPKEINLSKDEPSYGSAFLLQLRRQALLLTAQDEFGAVIRDGFIIESGINPAANNAADGSVKIESIDDVAVSKVEYKDHQTFLAEIEKRSRKEFIAFLESKGLKKDLPPPNNAFKERNARIEEIEISLKNWALIPQFNALRKTHQLIRHSGESPELLTLLVKGYTQVSMMTDFAPLDTHRIFQARAMLYAQRLVAKYGSTPEYLALRAAAWSLNNFHRIARNEFAAVKETKPDVWFDFARLYADYNIKSLEEKIKTAEAKDKPLAALLTFFLYCYAGERNIARSFGESAIPLLPNCSRLYQGAFTLNNFDMLPSPNGKPFYVSLAGRIAPELLKIEELPDEVKEAVQKLRDAAKTTGGAGLAAVFGFSTEQKELNHEDYVKNLADVLQALSAVKDDKQEPSLQTLAVLLRDDELSIAVDRAYGINSHNGQADDYILSMQPVIGSHPAAEFLGLACRNPSNVTPFWHRLTAKMIPYNLFSQKCVGINKPFSDTDFSGRIYSPWYFACLFADKENVRDLDKTHACVILTLAPYQWYKLVDQFYAVCPNNPYAVAVRIARGRNITEQELEQWQKDFGRYDGVRNEIAVYYEKTGQNTKSLELMAQNPAGWTYQSVTQLVNGLLRKNQTSEAVEVLKKFIKLPQAQEGLLIAEKSRDIGWILMQERKWDEAEKYVRTAAATHSYWGMQVYAEYLQYKGQRDESAKWRQRIVNSYGSESDWDAWCSSYCADYPNAEKFAEKILQKYERYKSAGAADTKTLMENKTDDWTVLYICYCMDKPYPKALGSDPLMDVFLRGGNGIAGFLAYFDALEKKEEKRADRILNLIRELWYLTDKSDPFAEAQAKVLPRLTAQEHIHDRYKQLAAMFQEAKRNGTPGKLNEKATARLLEFNYGNMLSAHPATHLLYVLGRYYDFYGEPEKAAECYRTILAQRANANYTAGSFAVKELRKKGMTQENYLEYITAESPLKATGIQWTLTVPDKLASQYFDIWTDKPAETLLAKPAATQAVLPKDFGKNQKLSAGYYKVKRALFRGHAVDDKTLDVYWEIPEQDDKPWADGGIANHSGYMVKQEPQLPDGSYPLLFNAAGNALSAAAAFHGKNAVLTISLVPGEKIDFAHPLNCVRIELEKVADLPKNNPLQKNREQSAAQTLQNEQVAPDTHLLSKTIGGIAVLLLLLALLLQRRKKKQVKSD